MKILYVEDNDDNVYMLKNRLTRAGFTFVVAADGARGIDAVWPANLTSTRIIYFGFAARR